MTESRKGAYGADDDIVDFILGITFEIWEERGVDLIRRYYADDCIVWGLDGITHGAQAVVDATWATLDAFPDRKLLAEHVIWSGNRENGYYTSHRLLSMATNEGPTVYGPATGTRIRMTNIADCVVENGVITREWLVRDNMMFATQLSADPIEAARGMRAKRSAEHQHWLDEERSRVGAIEVPDSVTTAVGPSENPEAFAWRALWSAWTGNRTVFDTLHAPYCVLHRSPFRHYSGRGEVFGYYETLGEILGQPSFSVDHIAAQPFSSNGIDIAVRWTAAGTHQGEVMGIAPTGNPMFILGITHWRCIAGRIAIEMTVFDDLAVLSQLLEP
jgi:predicted ester cyclase